MFQSTKVNINEDLRYNFFLPENSSKWMDILITALKDIKTKHNLLSFKTEAYIQMGQLIYQTFSQICLSQPHSLQDVISFIQRSYPPFSSYWLESEDGWDKIRLKKLNSYSLPADKIHQILVKEVFGYKIEQTVTIYIVDFIEYIATEFIKLVTNYAKDLTIEAKADDVNIALCADKALMNVFKCDDEDDEDDIFACESPPPDQQEYTYEDIVRDFLIHENQYVRELKMINKLFKPQILKKLNSKPNEYLKEIFEMLNEIRDLSIKLIGLIDDVSEARRDGEDLLIGTCFDDLLEGLEFDVYDRYFLCIREESEIFFNFNWSKEYDTNYYPTDSEIVDSIRYVFPHLLLDPLWFFLHYCETLKRLLDVEKDVEEDVKYLKQAYNRFIILGSDIEKLATKNPNIKASKKLAFFSRIVRTGCSRNKLEQIQQSIEGWDGKNILQSCSTFITEGSMQKISGKRVSDRYVFLFDKLVVFTKKISSPYLLPRKLHHGPSGAPAVGSINSQRVSNASLMPQHRPSSGSLQRRAIEENAASLEYKFKEKFSVHKMKIIDRPDTDEFKNCFELHCLSKPQLTHILIFKNLEEKMHWISSFVFVLNRNFLNRKLDSILKEEAEGRSMLKPLGTYKFSIEDSDENIVFEDTISNSEVPLIRGGTLYKLVERLTYHTYADPKFVKTFLTTYRTFCKPEELLQLLIERYEIPIPEVDSEFDNQDEIKIFRDEYCKPIMFRVLNVMKQWVDQHWHDFESNTQLRESLYNFLRQRVTGKAQHKWAESLLKIFERKKQTSLDDLVLQVFATPPPPIEWHLTKDFSAFDLMNLHPVEIARQTTLLEFECYRKIRSSEMVGGVWMKKNKAISSPNLFKMIQHSTKLTFWLEKCIVESENFEERVAVVSRVIEIMAVFQELNNFNGVIEVNSALNSAPVHRLEHTFEEVERKFPKLVRVLEEARELNADHFKKYFEKLRSINPPCIPFLGMYLTNILHLEDGNPDFLLTKGEGLINFNKRRKVADITAEIHTYQNQPYCLHVEPNIRTFIENLDPLKDRTEDELRDYLYEKSLYIEPRNNKPIKMDRKREYSLKSPGIKLTQNRFNFKHLMNIGDHEPIGTGTLHSPPNTPDSAGQSQESGDEMSINGSISSGFGSSNSNRSTLSMNGSLTRGSTETLCSTNTIYSTTTQCSQPPPLPPRTRNPLPPLPPRRDISAPNIPGPPIPPRQTMPSPNSPNDDFQPPALPPKTFGGHSRQMSS